MDWINIGKNITIAIFWAIFFTLAFMPDRLDVALLTFFAIFTVILLSLAIVDEILQDNYIWQLVKDILSVLWAIILLIDMIFRR